MNLILLFDDDFTAENKVRLMDRRLVHARDILRVKLGDSLTVGKLNGLMGQGKVTSLTDTALELEIHLTDKAPQALPMTLIMPLSRPPVLKRILLCAASLGFKKIIILNFSKVEKSLWNSSALRLKAIEEQLILGLEQAKDTLLPEVLIRERFKPFVEDELPALIKDKLALVAHPGGGRIPSISNLKPQVILIGPEGGLTDYEVDKLTEIGFKTVDLGPRIIRVESVLPLLVGKWS